MLKIALLLGSACLVSLGGLALAHARTQLAPPVITIAATAEAVPFELFRGNRIFVPARINGHPAEVLLDTGASATTLDRAYARSIGLPPGRKVTGHGAGGPVEAELVSGIRLDIGGMHFERMTVAVMDLALVSRGIGRPANIILGREFFNAAVVSIDWSNSRLTLAAPAAFRPAPEATALPLSRRGPFNTIPVSIAGGPPIEALLDLGNGGNLVIPRSQWGPRRDLAGLRFAESRMGGVGGLHAARSALVPEVVLAGRRFVAVPAILSETGTDERAETMTNVGIGLLKQFHVDLDLGRDRIYLTPRSDAPAFDRDRSGTRLELIGDRLKVAFVSPQGPAAAAGLTEGDEIVAIDGRRVTAEHYRGRDWTRGAAGQAVELERSDGSRLKITLADYY